MNRIGMRLFVVIGLFLSIFSSLLLYRTYTVTNQHVFQVVSQQADMALQFNLSIREYVGNAIRPVMYEFVGDEEFIPETMSTSFVARSIFEDTRKYFPDFILKFSSDNPRNPKNQAGPQELEVIQYLNNHPEKTTWEGNITINKISYFAKFKARRMEKSCLRCHGDPADAPASMVKRYGATAGFHRPLGKVIALDAVAIPISSVQEHLWAELRKNFTMIGIGFVGLLIIMFTVVKCIITNRLSTITKHFADAASPLNYVPVDPLKVQGRDEISALADSFNRLASKMSQYHSSLENEIQERTKANRLLKEEIAERKKAVNKLKQSQSTLENVFQSINPLCITNVEYEVLQANEAYYELWPRACREGSPVRCYETRPGSLCATDLCPLTQIIRGKEEVTVESTKYEIGGQEREFIITARPFRDADGKLLGMVESFQDITYRKSLEREKEELIGKLQESLNKVKLLSGFLPICAACKKIRDDKGYWNQIEKYIKDHSEADFSHGLCPECAKKLYPDLDVE
jgi:PAS domain-containing protein